MRIRLHGRRVAGWIVELDPEPTPDVELIDLAKWSGHGPAPEVMELCDWVARRWLGAAPKLLRTASPPKNVYRIPPSAVARWEGLVDAEVAQWFEGTGSTVRFAPCADRWPIVLAAAARGNPLLIVPTDDVASRLAGRLRAAGLRTALLPKDWDIAAAGAVVVGTRAAVFGPTANLGAVLVFDEHDDALREERAPTWHAREVALERARRADVPCLLVSPTPSPEAVLALKHQEPSRAAEHGGWPVVEVVDRRDEPPGRLGLFSERVSAALREPGRIACVLNRTGRVRLLACSACGELVRCERCEAVVRQHDSSELVCTRCALARPPACAKCGSARLKNLVVGVGRAREELAALVGEQVGEWTAGSVTHGDARVVIGTEALLRSTPERRQRFATVIFLDFDQHLTAIRQRADLDALSLLVLAARHVGPRRSGGRILLQTRSPEHPVVVAARRADPAPVTAGFLEQAEAMRWPPVVAEAVVSGPGAGAFVEQLGRPLGIDVMGPIDDRWLLRSDDRDLLLDRLRSTDRGSERLRLAVT